ncbi:hypothetical protein [Streptomyces sp. NPDC002547]
MNVRADVAELLHAGFGDRTIARQLSMPLRDVTRARQDLRIPPARSGNKRTESLEDLFWRRVKPVDGGHLEWTGYRNNTGAPSFKYGGRGGQMYSAYRVAFRIANGRDPEGYALPSCGFDGCVKPGHHEDRVMREQERNLDSLFGAIFGGAR